MFANTICMPDIYRMSMLQFIIISYHLVRTAKPLCKCYQALPLEILIIYIFWSSFCNISEPLNPNWLSDFITMAFK